MANLISHRKRPALVPFNMGQISVIAIMAKYKSLATVLQSYGEDLMAHPEEDAISFYLSNAAYAQMALEREPESDLKELEPIMEFYQDTVKCLSLRMFFYLLLICTRESRHLHSSVSFMTKCKEKFGSKSFDFLQSIKGVGSDTAVKTLQKSPPDVPLGLYCEHLVYVFQNGSWGGGYGGKAWAAVAKVLREFVIGQTSAELMLDTAFTLCHNNGPIFNKGMLFHCYNGTEIMKVLDVQRAGMIPQFVMFKHNAYVKPKHTEFLHRAQEVMPTFGEGIVDWFQVQKLGAKGHYFNEQKKQKLLKQMNPGEGYVTIAHGIEVVQKKIKRAS